VEINQLNQHGGILGHKVVLQAYDDKLDPQTTVQVATEVADNPNVALVVGPDISSFFDAAKSIIAGAKKAECEVAIDSDTALNGQPYAFNMNPDNKVVVDSLLNYLKKHTSVRSVGMVYERDASGEQANSEFQASASKYGIKYLGVQYTSSNEANYVPQIQKLMSSGAIYMSNLTPNNVETAVSAQQAGYKGLIINGTGAQTYFYPQGAGPAASGTIFVGPPIFLPGLTSVPESQWPSGYRDFYNQSIAAGDKIAHGTKPGLEELEGTADAAACIQFWAAAARRAGSLNGPAVAKAWESLNVPASQNALGLAATFENRQLFHNANQLYIYRWHYADGKWAVQTLAKPQP
jgi:branched-chain amino acid transport system substrate-binding protein